MLDWDTLEVDPSTRTSVALWTKYLPADVTLTTPQTAQNLISISNIRPTRNIATNPSFETGAPPTGYTASGAALSQSAVVARNGTNSMLINPDNAAAGEGFYWTTPVLGGHGDGITYVVVSAYFNDNAGSGNGARIIIANTAGTALSTGNTVTLAASWQRSFAALQLTPAGAAYRIYGVTATQHDTNFYADGFQVEIFRGGGTPTDYCDGSLGLNYEWEGTAHASTSIRRGGLVAVRGFDLHFTRDTYISFDRTASTTDGGSIFMRAGTDWSPEHPIHFNDNISFINSISGEQPRVWGAVWGMHIGRA